MKINISRAVRLFFPNTSLELVYFEAIANAIDAGATIINIDIKIKSFKEPDSLQLQIKDNGIGFVDDNFNKFSKLLETAETDHKGIGRLIFLQYFNSVTIESWYQGNKRYFTFDDKFEGDSKVEQSGNNQGSILTFNNYKKEKIKAYDYLIPASIKESILIQFFPLLHRMKLENKELKVTIGLTVSEPNFDLNFYSDVAELTLLDIPDLEKIEFVDHGIDLFEPFELYYSVKRVTTQSKTVVAICVDGRTVPLNLLSKENIPMGYDVFFLLYSNFFSGKVSLSRQELTLKEYEINSVKRMFKEKISEILRDLIPEIDMRNREIQENLSLKYPHLEGYFESSEIGIIDKNKALEFAQMKFFKDQKEILEATNLTEEQYGQTLNVTARILMEYILYRNITLDRLKKVNTLSDEYAIHDIVVPRRKVFKRENFNATLYTNNAWLLDDKYMTFSTILSEKDMSDLVHTITNGEENKLQDVRRPDIAIVFSDNPEAHSNGKVDVVIVELKKLGLKLAKKEEVVSQLKQRARKLYEYFPNKIQRIWFYGIVDIDREFERSLLEDGFVQLYSADKVFYKEHPIIPDIDIPSKTIPAGLFVLSFEAFLKDAENRNSTFLNLLKDNIKRSGTREDIENDVPF